MQKVERLFLSPLLKGVDQLLVWIAHLRSPIKKEGFFESPPEEKAENRLPRSPREIFPPPEGEPDFRVLSTRAYRGVKTARIAFPTPEPSGFPENDGAIAYFTENTVKKNRAAAVFVHPWMSKSLALDHSWCRDFARNGVDSIALILPYHMERSPEGSFSGEFTLRGDPSAISGKFKQAVSEIQLLYFYLRRHYRSVGIIGLSLGAYVAHIGMIVQPFDFGISLLAGAPLADMFHHSIYTRRYRKLLMKSGISLTKLEKAWYGSDPVTWGPFNRAKKILMINALYDRVVPPDLTEKLREAFGRPEIIWYPCAHFSLPLFYRSVRKKMFAFIFDQKTPSRTHSCTKI